MTYRVGQVLFRCDADGSPDKSHAVVLLATSAADGADRLAYDLGYDGHEQVRLPGHWTLASPAEAIAALRSASPKARRVLREHGVCDACSEPLLGGVCAGCAALEDA